MQEGQIFPFLTELSATTKLLSMNRNSAKNRYLHSTFQQVISRTLVSLLFLLVSSVASGSNPTALSVNIFGDGNPDNGIEDDRQQIMGGRNSATGLSDQQLNGGAIKCDGKIRGSAMVVDTREIAPALNGVILATAAHVLYDLEKKRLFKRCQFHFLALDQLASYRAKIDLKQIRLGGFDPTGDIDGAEFGEGDWAFLYIPKPWKLFRPDESLTLADFSSMHTESYQQSGGVIRLIAYDSQSRVMSSSSECTVIESHLGDLGGGSWKGQLLDDCDSADGASGGGIVAVVNHQHYLIGIRSGAHWSEDIYPLSSFPMGPPEGAPWSRQFNTNFGRAIDAKVIHELKNFVHQLDKYENTL
jgi:hypothetical protein